MVIGTDLCLNPNLAQCVILSYFAIDALHTTAPWFPSSDTWICNKMKYQGLIFDNGWMFVLYLQASHKISFKVLLKHHLLLDTSLLPY